MFGTNSITKPEYFEGKEELLVKSVFRTIQGEGPYSGIPAIFVRLGKCNLRCWFCFSGKTNIAMGDGSKKKISEVSVGDQVMAYDQETSSFKPGKVTRVYENEVDELLRLKTDRNGPVHCTPDHPFLVKDKGWVKAENLEQGDVIIHYTNSDRMKICNPMYNESSLSKAVATAKANGAHEASSVRLSARYDDSEFRAKLVDRMTNNNPMKNPETALKSFTSSKRKKHKTGIERKFEEIVEGLPIEFVGHGDLVVGNKVPDFVITGQNKVIEVWSSSAPYSVKRNEAWIKERSKLFEQHGYKSLFIPIPNISKSDRDSEYNKIRKSVSDFIYNGETVVSVGRVRKSALRNSSEQKAWVRLAGGKDKSCKVHNLEVEKYNTYVAEHKVVHNCDEDFERDLAYCSVDELFNSIQEAKENSNIKLVVITGGEPTLQHKALQPLIYELVNTGHTVQIETAGTVNCVLFGADIVVSPKTSKLLLYPTNRIIAYKYVVEGNTSFDKDGIPINKAKPHSKAVPVYLSPCDEHCPESNALNTEKCVSTAIKHGHRVNLQIHKILNMA